MATHHHQSDRARLHAFMKRSTDMVRLGVVVFRLNPASFEMDSEFIVQDVQTLAGFGRFDFGSAAQKYTLDGFTGIDGLDGPGGLLALEQYRPQDGRQSKLLPFRYPNRFRGVRWVYVTRFRDTISQDKHLYNSYHLELIEYPKHKPAAAGRVAGAGGFGRLAFPR